MLAGGINYVKVTCETSTLTHYYVIKDGDSTLHMATYATAGMYNEMILIISTHAKANALQNRPSVSSAGLVVSTKIYYPMTISARPPMSLAERQLRAAMSSRSVRKQGASSTLACVSSMTKFTVRIPGVVLLIIE